MSYDSMAPSGNSEKHCTSGEAALWRGMLEIGGIGIET